MYVRTGRLDAHQECPELDESSDKDGPGSRGSLHEGKLYQTDDGNNADEIMGCELFGTLMQKKKKKE